MTTGRQSNPSDPPADDAVRDPYGEPEPEADEARDEASQGANTEEPAATAELAASGEPRRDPSPEPSRRGPRRRQRRRARDVNKVRQSWLPELPFDSQQALDVLLIVAVAGSVLAVGSVHPIVMLVVAALSAAAGALALHERLLEHRGLPLLWPAVGLAALAAASALQTIPLPMGALRAIAPANADVWARALLPFGEGSPSSAPVSLDPGASAIEVVRWTSYAALFAAAAVVAARRGAKFGVGVVFGSAVVAALTTIGHGLLGMTEVWGLYEPAFQPSPWHLGPLLNPNNLSGYLNLGALCGLGLLVSDNLPWPRWTIGIGVAVILGVNVTAASRGGLLVLPIAVLALAVVIEINRWRKAQSGAVVSRARWLLGGAVAFGALLAGLASTQQIWDEILQDNIEKLEMVGWIRPMIGQFRWLGLGRGAFESVSPAFQPGSGSVVFTHAENFVAQWLVEWGMPVGIAALAGLAWLLRPGRLRVGRSTTAAGAWIGVLAVLLHNLVDLGLEIPGVAIGLVVTLGTLWGGRRHHAGEAPGPERPGRALAWSAGLLAVSMLVIALGAWRGLRDLPSDRIALATLVLKEPAPRPPESKAAIRAFVRSAILRHPADPYFPLVGATLAWQERDENPIPWLQRVLERSLVNGRAHLLLAQVLATVPVRHQALLELRLAVESDPSLVGYAATLALRWAMTFDELLSSVPSERGSSRSVRAASFDTLGATAMDRALGARLDALAIELEPTRPGPHERLAKDLVAKLGKPELCPDESKCEQELEQHLVAIEAAHPTRSSAVRLRAERLAALGKADEAEKLLAAECESFDDHQACLQVRATMASQIPDVDRLTAAGKALLTSVCMDQERCAESATWLGDLHAGRKEWGAAVNFYKQAIRDGENADRHVKLATAASQAGMHAQAMRSLERALALKGQPDGELQRRIAEEREKATAPLLGH